MLWDEQASAAQNDICEIVNIACATNYFGWKSMSSIRSECLDVAHVFFFFFKATVPWNR